MVWTNFVTFLTDRLQCRSVFKSLQHQHLPQAFTSSKIQENTFFSSVNGNKQQTDPLRHQELCHTPWNKCHSSAWPCIPGPKAFFQSSLQLQEHFELQILSTQSLPTPMKSPCHLHKTATHTFQNFSHCRMTLVPCLPKFPSDSTWSPFP